MAINLLKLKNAFSVLLLTSITIEGYAQSNSDLKTDTLKDVVVSASRVPEKILQSPVSIEKVSAAPIRNRAAPSFFDALENVKGVQMITPSLGFKVINTRGFANPTNVRFVQMVDGIDNQAPHIGGPIGNALGPNDLDIAGAEIIPGAASALYGMNAINGLANFITKDPFLTAGISFQQKTGFNSVGNHSDQFYNESAIRIAHLISKKLAFKLSATYTKGYDFTANNNTDLNPNINASAGLTGNANPAYDAVNGYGNESSNRRTLMLNGKSYVVARTGYYESEVADYNLQNIKADGSVHYKLSNKTRLSYTYRFALLDNVYQRSNRFRLQDYFLGQQSLNLENPVFQLKAYQTVENTGKSYNLRSMAENLDRSYKKDDVWFTDYTAAFNQAIADQKDVGTAHIMARTSADAGRLQPGTAAFKSKLQELQDINNWDIGAALRVKAKLYHTEGQLNVSKLFEESLEEKLKLDVLTGFDYRLYDVTPDGNYFINPVKGKEYDDLLYSKLGGFIQAGKKLFNEKLKLGATLRLDKSEYYSAKFNPRFTAVYSPEKRSAFRASYQTGYRFPSLFEAFSNVNSGGVKRVGGVPAMSNGIFENSWLRTSVDAFQAAVIKDVNSNGLSTADAIRKNQGLLQKNSYTYLEPEKLRSFEFGYRTLALNEKIFLDADFYYNRYQSFIGQIEVNIPKTSNTDSIGFYLNDKKLQDRYRMWTNSKTVVYNYGGSIGLQINLPSYYKVSTNASFSKLDKKTGNDGLEDGFNTPKWITNISISNPRAYKNVGFNLTYKWQSGYYWQSFLVNGNVPAYRNVDAQINYAFQNLKLNVKAGASNILNQRYYSFLGGPQIGGLYYTSLTYGL